MFVWIVAGEAKRGRLESGCSARGTEVQILYDPPVFNLIRLKTNHRSLTMQRSFIGGVARAHALACTICAAPPHFSHSRFAWRAPGEVAESVEGAPLLREYVPKGHQGFESLPLRHFKAIKSLKTNHLARGCIGEIIRPTPRQTGRKCRG